ncbi:MAG: PAS domain S-box protein [Candidatus Melainabacteria bacterium]|nr:MAG: PAS domain S-box protein [Candidatus Melainabacteria bacterium]
MDIKKDSMPNEMNLLHRQLQHEQKRYQELFDSAPDGYILTNAVGEITRCNEAAALLLDAPRAHLVGESIISFISLEDRLITKESIDTCIDGKGTQRFEAQIQTGKEDRIHAFVTLNCPGLSDTDINELHWRIQDISIRITAEEKHSQLRAIVALSSDAVIETSANGAIVSWNDGAEILFGHSANNMIGQSILTLVSEAAKSELFDFFNKSKRQEIELNFPIVTKDFINKHVKMKVTLVKDRKGKVSNCSAVFRDITSEMQNENDLRIYLKRLVDIQEKERARIAQELHDGTGQHLAAVGLALGAIINNYDQTVPIEKKLQNLQSMLTELGREIHNVAWELRPPSLDKHGLVPALKHYTEIWSNRTGINVEFLATGVESVRASSTVETALFRIVQESFTNIAKHANASKVNVILQQHKNEIHLVVEDNGEGFPTENDRESSGQSMGLSGMKERANLAGGNFQIESSHGHGTAIFVRVPFEKRD